MSKVELIRVKLQKNGKARVCFTQWDRSKWFTIEAKSIEEARRLAKTQEKFLLGSLEQEILFSNFAADFYDPQGEWAKYIESKGRRPFGGYYTRFKFLLKNYILPEWGAVPLTQFASQPIDSWVATLKSTRKGTLLSPDSRNQILTCFKHIFDYAKYQDLIDKNPIDGIKQYHGGESRAVFRPEEINILFPGDEEAFAQIWPKLIWRTFFLILRDTGLRTGEALALAWENYSPEYGSFAIVQKFEVSTGRILPGTKTERPRAVVLSKRTMSHLKQLKKEQNRESGLIFSLDGGKPYSMNNVNDRLRDGLSRAGVPHYVDKMGRPSNAVEGQARSCYSFRHAFVTNALAMSLHPDDVALLAGHSRQVQNQYNHPDNRHLMERVKHLRDQVEELYGYGR